MKNFPPETKQWQGYSRTEKYMACYLGSKRHVRHKYGGIFGPQFRLPNVPKKKKSVCRRNCEGNEPLPALKTDREISKDLQWSRITCNVHGETVDKVFDQTGYWEPADCHHNMKRVSQWVRRIIAYVWGLVGKNHWRLWWMAYTFSYNNHIIIFIFKSIFI